VFHDEPRSFQNQYACILHGLKSSPLIKLCRKLEALPYILSKTISAELFAKLANSFQILKNETEKLKYVLNAQQIMI